MPHPLRRAARPAALAGLFALVGCADAVTGLQETPGPEHTPRFSMQPASGPVLNPANGHSYELVPVATGSRWAEARLAAALRGGYLATLTSAEEADFVVGLAGGEFRGIYWLGGYQASGAPEPAGGWRWVTDEPWAYQNWESAEPNNFGGAEDHLSLYLFGRGNPATGKWNDRHQWLPIAGYVVEYEPDSTPPQATPSLQGVQGENGWYISDVVVSWSVVDPETPVTILTGCAETALTEDTSGLSLGCQAISPGGTVAADVEIRRDATAPVVTFTGNAGGYTVDQEISIGCGATDEGSGVAGDGCAGVSAPAHELGPGTHAHSVTVRDLAGNETTAEAVFQVQVTEPSLCTLVQRWVGNPGVARALCEKLESAARARGNARQGLLGAFANQVRAQAGKSIPAAHAESLTRFAAAL